MKVWTKQKGFILPTLTSVTVILLILATALLTSGTSSLRTSTHDQQSDQAFFAAEAGLVRATAEYAKAGRLSSPYEGELETSGTRYVVTITENKTGVETNVVGGPEIPGKTVYFLSRGYSENGTYRETAALFQYGMEAFQVGALGDKIEITDSTFDAYDSSKGEYNPTAPENELPLLATNTGTGEPISLGGTTHIKGDLFVGKGGGDGQVARASSGTYSLGAIHPLDEPIKLEDIEVPEDESGGAGYWDIPPIGDLELINADGSGYHFSDGVISFTINPGPPTTNISEALSRITITSPHTNFFYGGAGDNYLGIRLDQTAAGSSQTHRLELHTTGYHTYVSNGSATSGTVSKSISNLLFNYDGGGGGSKDLVNESNIQPGHYDSITMNDGGTSGKLAKSGVYVIKNLNVSPGNSIALDNPDLDVTIYVTESMSVDGKDTIVNSTRRAPKMKIFYTGTNEVNLQGGSQSYYSLIAKDAKVSLRSLDPGAPTHFYGALVGSSVNVTNAMFHFDVATKGIGTGTRGTGILLMNRHRL